MLHFGYGYATALILLALLCSVLAGSAAHCAGEPVPEYRTAPQPPREYYPLPTITAVETAGGQDVTLTNYALSATIHIDSDKHASITGLRTESGRELLTKPSPGFQIVSGDGKVVKDGAVFSVERWHTWRSGSYVEIEMMLQKPVTLERAIWRVRLYRDRPYLEQRFELPDQWRVQDRSLNQALNTSPSLKPVMPVNVMKMGFKQGSPNRTGRHRFEYVDKCEHVVYDSDTHAGLACFAAGLGGEELMTPGQVLMLDHATPALGEDDPLGRFILIPFDGPVERGFMLLKRFVADEYACQGTRYPEYTWNQFWLWQGKHQDWGFQEVTADRLMDILPHIKAMGTEQLHLDAGWEEGMNRGGRSEDQDWNFDPQRFPQGFDPIRRYLRANGMGYCTHMFQEAVNKPDVLTRIIRETDLSKLFIDQNADEKTLACLVEVRKQFPELQVFCHSMSDARRKTSYWSWGNTHYLSVFNQVYFGEGTWGPYMADLPPHQNASRFVDLFTRSGSYQAAWIWPYKCIHPPHAGYTLGGSEWRGEPEWTRQDETSLILTTVATRYMFGWGEDPRLMKRDTLDLLLDWTAFWKVFRQYLNEYQHVLPVPDGIHPDGAAHVKDGEGFIVLFNPSDKAQSISLKDMLWEPELELDPRRPVELSDWDKPLQPTALKSVDLSNPKGDLSIGPLGYRVVGVNLDVGSMKKEVVRERSLLR